MEKNNVGNVTFIHRRVERKLKEDCIAVHKRNEDSVFQVENSTCMQKQLSYLANSDAVKTEPELCYEMSYRYPEGSYLLYAEGP